MLSSNNKTKTKWTSWLHSHAENSSPRDPIARPRLTDRWSFSSISKLKLKRTASVDAAAAAACVVESSPDVPSLGMQHFAKPPLQGTRSMDATDELKEAIDSIESAASMTKANARKCHSEWSKAALEQQHRSWLALHEQKCDAQRMLFEASHRCLDHERCGCSQRVHFILRYCEQFMDGAAVDADAPGATPRATKRHKFALFHQKKSKQKKPAQVRGLTIPDAALSKFMSALSEYSHMQLTRDFRHLQIFHSQLQLATADTSVDFTDTKALIACLYKALAPLKEYARQPGPVAECPDTPTPTPIAKVTTPGEHDDNVLTAVSKLMMRLQSKQEFNAKYMKLGLMTTGANGKIFAVKSWKSSEFFALKEIAFENLGIELKHELLRNWSMVQEQQLLGDDTELFMDAKKDTLLIVQHLYRGSMCDYLKDLYAQKQRCLSEAELRTVLRNGVLQSLKVLHSQSYIHGDIKPENIVYEFLKNQHPETTTTTSTPAAAAAANKRKVLHSAIIDYDLCAKIEATSNPDGVECEWRGTLGYAAPEWSPYSGVKSLVDTSTDVFSLALTMLILLCGQQPFLCPTVMRQKLQAKNPDMNIKRFVYETMLSNGEFMIAHFLQRLQPKISADLHALLKSMLQFDPKLRPNIHQVIEHAWLQR